MIEVNLIPGGKKRTAKKGGGGKRRSVSLSMPKMGGDPWVLGAVVAWIGVTAFAGWSYFSITTERGDVDAAVEIERQDSVRFAALIAQVEGLLARRDSILQRVDIIQGIDADRYVWPHVFDEIARALPDYTWLTGFAQTAPPPNLQISLTGQAGNNFAVAEFLTRLSDSPFIRVADLISSSQAVQNQGSVDQQIVYDFTFEVYFQPPPPEILEMVPLFDEGDLTGPPSGS